MYSHPLESMNKAQNARVHRLCIILEDQVKAGINPLVVTQQEHDMLRASYGPHYTGQTKYQGVPVVVG
jgi:hypothetical protein